MCSYVICKLFGRNYTTIQYKQLLRNGLNNIRQPRSPLAPLFIRVTSAHTVDIPNTVPSCTCESFLPQFLLLLRGRKREGVSTTSDILGGKRKEGRSDLLASGSSWLVLPREKKRRESKQTMPPQSLTHTHTQTEKRREEESQPSSNYPIPTSSTAIHKTLLNMSNLKFWRYCFRYSNQAVKE